MDANEKKLIEDKIMNILASPNFSYDNDHALGPNLCVSYGLSVRFFSPGHTDKAEQFLNDKSYRYTIKKKHLALSNLAKLVFW